MNPTADGTRAPEDRNSANARALLARFLARTGIEAGPGDPLRRYLWTDAHAVMALVALHGRTGDGTHLLHAARLVDLVHAVLGRHRPDDVRRGWISGLSEEDGARHPTAGGLRIGKPLPERAAGERFDPQLEWDRDGQYFHYLARWMLALDGLARAACDPRWNALAVELALRAHHAFLAPRVPGRPPHMHWKMSIDLSRPLVASMGHHDPLDGLVTALRLQSTRRAFGAESAALAELVQEDRLMCAEIGGWATHDALGIGGLLSALAELVDMTAASEHAFDSLVLELADAADESLAHWPAMRELGRPPAMRLAFRELGLAIGLRAVPAMCEKVEAHPGRFGGRGERAVLRASLESLRGHLDIAERIEECWRSPAAQASPSWTMHEDIDAVMLASSLLARPEGPQGPHELRRLSASR